jgi:hypothetical protein
MVGSRSFINLSFCLDSNHWFPPEMLVVCMGIEALWQFQLHTQYVKKIGVHREISKYSHHQVVPRTEY